MFFFMIATFTDLILRVLLAYVLSKPFGTNGIWTSWPIGWMIAAILSITFYFIVMKKLIKIKLHKKWSSKIIVSPISWTSIKY